MRRRENIFRIIGRAIAMCALAVCLVGNGAAIADESRLQLAALSTSAPQQYGDEEIVDDEMLEQELEMLANIAPASGDIKHPGAAADMPDDLYSILTGYGVEQKRSLPGKPSYVARYERVLSVGQGESFSELLVRGGISTYEAFEVSRAMGQVFNLRTLAKGQQVKLYLNQTHGGQNNINGQGKGTLSLAELYLDRPEYIIKLQRLGQGEESRFHADKKYKKLKRRLVRLGGYVETSLYDLSDELGVPANVMVDAVKSFSHDVDFQRDIREGNRFEVVYDTYYDMMDNKVRDGDLLYAMLEVRGEEHRIYRFDSSDKEAKYYTSDGRTIYKPLLRTPIDGAVISSQFGMRKHPILGYNKMHKGVDFAAPKGTPFYAAGDGVVVKMGKNGGYGNYIKIKHNDKYHTAYAHISRFARGIKKGTRVKQGQVIAYVGNTGRSTGPHLHFEILEDGQHVNPMTVKMEPGGELNPKDMKLFADKRQQIDSLLAGIPDGRRWAAK